MDFQQRVIEEAQKAVLKIMSDGSWIAPDYNNRFKLPLDFVTSAWALVDKDAVLIAFKKRLEAELADRLVNHLAAEISTDIKQLLSDREKREQIRAVARQHLVALAHPTQAG